MLLSKAVSKISIVWKPMLLLFLIVGLGFGAPNTVSAQTDQEKADCLLETAQGLEDGNAHCAPGGGINRSITACFTITGEGGSYFCDYKEGSFSLKPLDNISNFDSTYVVGCINETTERIPGANVPDCYLNLFAQPGIATELKMDGIDADEVTGRCAGEPTSLNLSINRTDEAGVVAVRPIGCMNIPSSEHSVKLYYSLNGDPCTDDGSANEIGSVGVADNGLIDSFPINVDIGTASSITVCASNDDDGQLAGVFGNSGNYDLNSGTISPRPVNVDDDANQGLDGAQGFEACALSDTTQLNNTCLDCLKAGATWTALGCIDTSPEGLFTAILRIALGVMGGVALLRMIYLGYLYQTGDEAQIKEARSGIISTLLGIVVVVFSVLILRIIGVNILDVVPAGFYG